MSASLRRRGVAAPGSALSASAGAPCPSCGGRDTVAFYELHGIPVHSTRLLADRRSALAIERGDLQLRWCRGCDFVTNDRFDPERVDYSVEGYEDSQMGSATFRAFATELADSLIRRHRLHGGCVLEVGAGKGEFLDLLATRGDLVGIGLDPASPTRDEGRVHLRREALAADHAMLPFDLLVCRHTLEHIPDVARFTRLVRTVAGARERPVFFEVPDAERIFAEGAFWDVYYEHCSYFSARSLRKLFEREGFRIVDLRTAYGGQYLVCEARPDPDPPLDLTDSSPLAPAILDFIDTVAAARERWSRRFAEARDRDERVVLWGAGSKAVGLISAVPEAAMAGAVVDVDPAKHGRFLPGSGLEIVAPDALTTIRPDLVVVMNALYRPEITEQVRALGLVPTVEAL